MIMAAFVPAALLAFLLEKRIKALHGSLFVIAMAFVIGGIVMLIVERLRPKPVVMRADDTPIGRAVGVGVFQAAALVPGVSRSGATIIGGMLLGLDRPAAAEFSFFLAMPTMAAAFAKDLWEVRHHLVTDQGAEILVGFVMAFIASLLVVKPFLRFVGRSGFAPFAWYRIALGAAILWALWAGKL
jgi:undecaprenyl-diphosphatase